MPLAITPGRTLTLLGTRDELLRELAPLAPLHVMLRLVAPTTTKYKVTAEALHDAHQQPRSLACPALLHGKAVAAGLVQVGILTPAGFHTGEAACHHCQHQLLCAVDGQTRLFKALTAQIPQENSA
jgi:hypothetical protein